MLINKSNLCKVCGRVYKIIINRPGMCGDDESNNISHIGTY